MKKKSIKQRIKDLDAVIKVQCSDGNWNYDEYMHGLANGLLVAQAIIKATEIQHVNLLTAPKKWLKDCKTKYTLVISE